MKKSIAQNIVDCRRLAGMSQERLAWIIGVSTGTVSRWERGVCEPPLAKFYDICVACGRSLELKMEAKQG